MDGPAATLPSSRTGPEDGLGLAELLVALAVGSVVMLGCLHVALLARTHRQDQLGLQRLHERARHALSALEADLQLAGFYGLAKGTVIATELPAGSGAEACGAELPSQLSRPLLLLRGPWPLPCPPAGGGLRDGSDVLVLRRASIAQAAPEAGRVQLYSRLDAPGASRLLTDGSQVGESTPGGPARAELRDLILRIYYLARRADGDPSGAAGTGALRLKNLTRIAGRPAFIDTEVLPGVTGFTLEPLASLPDGTPTALLLSLTLQPPAGPSRSLPPLVLRRPVALRNLTTD